MKSLGSDEIVGLLFTTNRLSCVALEQSTNYPFAHKTSVQEHTVFQNICLQGNVCFNVSFDEID